MVMLAELKVASIQEIWEKETKFSDWLASEDGLKRLKGALGIDTLEVIGTEVPVDGFYADVVCRNPNDDSLVVIENQFNRSDHEHLGKLLTYGFGLNAATMVWIVEDMNDEHRAALDRLNEESDAGRQFFGIEVSLGKVVEVSQDIEKESIPFLHLIFVSRPNEWAKKNHIARGAKLHKESMIRYWDEFFVNSDLPAEYSQTMGRTHHNSFRFSVLNDNFLFIIIRQSLRVGVALRIQAERETGKQYFELLEADKETIEQEFGDKLKWGDQSNTNFFQISFYRSAKFKIEKHWPEQHAWLAEHLKKFDAVFRERIQNLPDAESFLKEGEADAEEDPAD